jgi:hypothetical protein
MGKPLNWIGERYGRLTIVALVERRGHKKMFRCLCDCGNETVAQDSNLRSGHSMSCGCLLVERRSAASVARTTHGMTGSDEHDIWINMKQRCHNPNNPAFDRYGGRGIIVCDEWRNSFEVFLADMGPRPSPGHSIDRIDNDRGYEPGNVRWATGSEQMKNRRPFDVGGKLICHKGEMITVRRLAKRCGLSPSTLYKRLDNGWHPDDIAAPADRRFATSASASRTPA